MLHLIRTVYYILDGGPNPIRSNPIQSNPIQSKKTNSNELKLSKPKHKQQTKFFFLFFLFLKPS